MRRYTALKYKLPYSRTPVDTDIIPQQSNPEAPFHFWVDPATLTPSPATGMLPGDQIQSATEPPPTRDQSPATPDRPHPSTMPVGPPPPNRPAGHPPAVEMPGELREIAETLIMYVPREAIDRVRATAVDGGYIEEREISGDDGLIMIFSDSEEHRDTIAEVCEIVVLPRTSLLRVFVAALSKSPLHVALALAAPTALGAFILWLYQSYGSSCKSALHFSAFNIHVLTSNLDRTVGLVFQLVVSVPQLGRDAIQIFLCEICLYGPHFSLFRRDSQRIFSTPLTMLPERHGAEQEWPA